jgi:hypothetical protein
MKVTHISGEIPDLPTRKLDGLIQKTLEENGYEILTAHGFDGLIQLYVKNRWGERLIIKTERDIRDSLEVEC